jgi:ATP-dependent Clp protease ATP-binding subunit ClpA
VYERFTDRARKVMIFANQEAQRLNHEYIGTEHLLLGLVREGTGTAAVILQNLDIELRKVRLEIEKVVLKGPDWTCSGTLPQTPKAKKVIEFAIDEARRQKNDCVGTEHLLLGLLRAEDGVAAQVLVNLGLTLAAVREQVNTFFPPRGTSAKTPRGKRNQEPVVLSELPAEIKNEVQDLDRQIMQLAAEKDEAVSIQDFEKAALLRDRADRLKKWRTSVVRMGTELARHREWARRVAESCTQITELMAQLDKAAAARDLPKAMQLRDELDRLQNQWQVIWSAKKSD